MIRASRILFATIGAPQGVRGEVRVKSFAAAPTALADYGPLRSEDGRRFEIERLWPAKGVVVVKFRGIDDRTAAEALNGVSLYIERSALPAPEAEEFYHADLIGLEAVDPVGKPLGIVATVQNFGAGDILEIAPAVGGASRLVPFTKAAVSDIDVAAGRITVVLPDEVEVKEGEIEAQEEET